ncbi:hypothetical protein NLJ89_g3930 [Agrocybe chaxingu]|uniref:DUF6534 domain-containing protein n=1 Tax=Agrocybe chaxingu TaxID=84603 RepID=A0A9W8K4A8_9AGAR|nr:hypothetical protein NLJ89_g3930 [Agrocybe chaxingu]
MAPHLLISLAEPSLDNTVGAALLGVVAAAFLFGVTTLQAYWYYHSYPNDSLVHKCSVGILWTLDALHLALTLHAVYTYAVKGFGDVLGLTRIVWSIKLQVSFNVVIVLIVHSLYALRVWLLGGYHRGVLGYLVASVVAGGFVIGIVLAYSIYTVDTYPQLDSVAWTIYAALGTSTTIDFVLAAAMCYYLRKSKGTITRLNSRISVIMQYTLGSGLFTSACSLSAMFLYILLPHTLIFLGVQFLLTKLYVGSFLIMLNARERKTVQQPTYEAVSTDASWQHKALKIRTTSSFWSPSPQSLASPVSPVSPPL